MQRQFLVSQAQLEQQQFWLLELQQQLAAAGGGQQQFVDPAAVLAYQHFYAAQLQQQQQMAIQQMQQAGQDWQQPGMVRPTNCDPCCSILKQLPAVDSSSKIRPRLNKLRCMGLTWAPGIGLRRLPRRLPRSRRRNGRFDRRYDYRWRTAPLLHLSAKICPLDGYSCSVLTLIIEILFLSPWRPDASTGTPRTKTADGVQQVRHRATHTQDHSRIPTHQQARH